MFTVTFGLLLLIALLSSCHSEELSPAAEITTLRQPKINSYSFDNDSAWIVNSDGVLTRYIPGEDRLPLFRSPTAKVNQTYFIDKSNGWIIDSAGQVSITKDGGESWTPQGLIEEVSGTSWGDQLTFTSLKDGWFVNPFCLWRTTDGGEHWNRVYPTDEFSYSKLKAQPYELFALDANSAWLGMTNGKVLKTTSAGRNWQAAHLPEVRADVHSLYCFDEQTCWAGTSGGEGLYFTSDGGNSWRQILEEKIRRSVNISSVFFTSTSHGWIVAQPFYYRLEDVPKEPKTILLNTTDAGKTWQKIEKGFPIGVFNEILFTSSGTGWLVGNDFVFRSTDAGVSWSSAVQMN